MQYTSYYNLNKPESTDLISIDDINDNFDTLDAALHNGLSGAGEATDDTVYFTEATSRTALTSGSTLGTIIGYISKWLSDLGDAAFYGVANNDTTTSSGSVADARIVYTHGTEIDKHTTQLGGLYFGTDSNGNWGYKTSSSGNVTAFRKPTGTATSAQVLSGYTFDNASSDGLSGSMNNLGNVVINLTSNTATKSAGYCSGITVNGVSLYKTAYNAGYSAGNSAGYSAALIGNASASHVLNGKSFTNASGVNQIGTMNNLGNVVINLTSNTATKSAGYCSGITVNGVSLYKTAYNAGYNAGNTAGYNSGYNAKTMTRTSLGSNSSGGRTVYTLKYNAKSISGYANLTAANFAITALSTAMYFSAGSAYSGSRSALSLSLSYNASNGIVTLSNTSAVSSGSSNNAGYDNYDNYVSAATVRCYYA